MGNSPALQPSTILSWAILFGPSLHRSPGLVPGCLCDAEDRGNSAWILPKNPGHRWADKRNSLFFIGVPTGIRTPVAAVKGQSLPSSSLTQNH